MSTALSALDVLSTVLCVDFPSSPRSPSTPTLTALSLHPPLRHTLPSSFSSEAAAVDFQNAEACKELSRKILWEVWSLEGTGTVSGPCVVVLNMCFLAVAEMQGMRGVRDTFRHVLSGAAAAIVAMANLALFGALRTDAAEERRALVRLCGSSKMAAKATLDLLTAVVAEAHESGTLADAFEPLLGDIADAALAELTIDGVIPLANLLVHLAASEDVCDLIVNHVRWLPSGNGAALATKSLIGPLLRASTLPRQLMNPTMYTSEEFPGAAIFAPNGLMTPDLASASHTSREYLSMLRQALHAVVRRLLSKAHRRERVVQYFASLVRANTGRTRMHADRASLADDGVMLNALAIYLKLCEPFVGPGKYEHVDDSHLLSPASLFDTSQESCVACTHEEGVAFRAKLSSNPFSPLSSSSSASLPSTAVPSSPSPSITTTTTTPLSSTSVPRSASSGAPAPPHFITSAFYTTLQLVRVGFLPASSRLRAEWMSREREKMNEENLLRAQALRDAAAIVVFTRQRTEMSTVVQSYFTELHDPQLCQSLVDFLGYVATWLLRLVKHSEAEPFPEKAPLPYAAFPDFIVDSFAQAMSEIMRFTPQLLDRSAAAGPIMRALVVLIGSRALISNPYLRAKLVEVMDLVFNHPGSRTDALVLQFQTDSVALQLGPSIMQFYVAVEDTDFYSKLNIRHSIQSIMRELWKLPSARRSMIGFSQGHLFLRFGMLILNDTTFLLDEGRSSILKLQQLQASATPDRAEVQRFESSARGAIALAKGTVDMLLYWTEAVVAPFVKPELVSRMASMLNCNMVALIATGDHELDLKLSLDYGLDPMEILVKMASIMVNVAGVASGRLQQPFLNAIGGDVRFYSKAKMQHVLEILRGNRSASDLARHFGTLLELVETAKAMQEQTDIPTDEIPEDYLDPITCELMQDPVELPTSHKIVDRSTISSHVLSDPSDPYNRDPLSLDDLIPRPDIKQAIAEWLQKRAAGAQ